MTARADSMDAGPRPAGLLAARFARRVLRPLAAWLATRMLRLARRLEGASVSASRPLQDELTREVLRFGGWSTVVAEADTASFAGELAQGGLLRRLLQVADAAQVAREIEQGVLLRRIAREVDVGQLATALVRSGLWRRVLQEGEVAVLAPELARSGLLQRIAQDGAVTRFASAVVHSGLLAPILRDAAVDRLAQELLESGLVERMGSAGRLALLPQAVQAPAALVQRWPDLDAILNFSAHLRHAWMAAQARRLPAGVRVLDAGAGEGQYRALLAHTRYQTQDFAQYGGSRDPNATESWNYVPLDYVCDITSIPVPDASFDAVICTEVLEHVPEPLAALRELARITAPGGRLLLSAPLGSGMHQEPFHYYGGYSRHFWARVLPELGFDIDEIVPLRGLMSHVAQEVHRAARYLAAEGRLSPEQAWVMQEWLPRALHEEDDAVPVEQFTVGYVVGATKRMGQGEANK